MRWRPANLERVSGTTWLLVLCWIGFAGLFLRNSVILLLEPYSLDYGEGITLMAGMRTLAGLPLYPPLDQAPYWGFTYPFVHPTFAALSLALFGENIFAVRLISVLSELGTALLVFGILRTAGLGRTVATTCAALLLYLFATSEYHAIARVDQLTLLFSMGGVWCLSRFWQQPRWRECLLAAPFFLAGLFTKPSAAMLLLACWCHAFIRLRHKTVPARQVLAMTAGVVLVAVAIAAVVDHATDGRFIASIVTDHLDSASRREWTYPNSRFFGNYAFPTGLVLLVVVFGTRQSYLRLLIATSLAWFAYAALKEGSAMNYAFEPLSFLCIGLGLFVCEVRDRLSARFVPLRGLTIERAALLVTVLVLIVVPQDQRRMRLTQPGIRQTRAEISRLTRDAPGAVLADEIFYAAINKKAFVVSDPYVALQRWRRGKFDFDLILDKCRRGEVSRVFVGPRLAEVPELMTVLRRHFRPVYRSPTRVTMRPWTVYDYAGTANH